MRIHLWRVRALGIAIFGLHAVGTIGGIVVGTQWNDSKSLHETEKALETEGRQDRAYLLNGPGMGPSSGSIRQLCLASFPCPQSWLLQPLHLLPPHAQCRALFGTVLLRCRWS